MFKDEIEKKITKIKGKKWVNLGEEKN